MESSLNAHYEQDQAVQQSRMSPHHSSTTQFYNNYRSIAPSVLDPVLHNHRSGLVGTTSQTRLSGSPSPRQIRQSIPKSLQSSPQVQTVGTPMSAVGRVAYSMSPPPQAIAVVAASRSSHNASLPSRDVTDSSIDDAYINFILFANPAVPKDVNTSELRRAFRTPPRSDGKSFSIYTLWELIRKLENKELKTWSQLAIELGVEPPSAEKGQSTQKIQQYAVRLKRWMRAMHVDAFFEYCLGKPHIYYSQLPPSGTEAIGQARDGVPLEEDLALRALVPDWRPKRGRKKVDEKIEIENEEEQPSKRSRVDPSSAALEYTEIQGQAVLFPHSQSAGIWSEFATEAASHNTWNMTPSLNTGAAIGSLQTPESRQFQTKPIGDFRWHRDLSPSGYPQSAITPSHSRIVPAVQEEPWSAVVPSMSTKTRTRRGHGPAVSSAWPSTSTTSNGKQRGRPPPSKSTPSGPFTTFPSRVSADRDGLSAPSDIGTTASPLIDKTERAAQQTKPPVSSTSTQPKPGKLQLQVPQHPGGLVRLATPPTVLVNGESGKHTVPAADIHGRRSSVDFFRDRYEPAMSDNLTEDFPPAFSIEDVCRAFAARLMSAKMVGRPMGLGLEEATLIALRVTQTICQSHQGGGAMSKMLAAKCALLLGVEEEMGLSSGSSHHVTVRAAFRNPLAMPKSRRQEGDDVRGSYDYTVSVDANEGDNLSSNMQIRNIVVSSSMNSELIEDEFEALRTYLKALTYIHEDADAAEDIVDESDVSWKQRFIEAERERGLLQEQLRRLRRMMLEVVISGG